MEDTLPMWESALMLERITREHSFTLTREKNFRDKFNNYEQLVLRQIFYSKYPRTDEDINLGHWRIPSEWCRRQLGQFTCPKTNKQVWFWDWMQNHYPMLEMIKPGFLTSEKGMISLMKPRYDLKLLLANSCPVEAVNEVYEVESAEDILNIPEDEIDFVPIDQASLSAFIKSNTRLLRECRTEQGRATINRYIQEARTILLISEHPDFVGHIPHIKINSPFGRTYYKGVNLQNVSKAVRHAALGDCYSYDLSSSVFTVFYQILRGTIVPWKYGNNPVPVEHKFTYMLDYIDKKKTIRRDIAKHVFQEEWKTRKTDNEWAIDVIKAAFTAIGFGGKAGVYIDKNGKLQKNSINTIIIGKEKQDRFLKHPFVIEFMQEMKECVKLIVEYRKAHFPETFDLNSEKSKIFQSEKGRISPAKVAAYVYQKFEARTIKSVIQHRKINCLLLTHDGFYTKNKIHLGEARESLIECQQLQFFGGDRTATTYMTLEEQKHIKFKFYDDSEEQAHREWIQQEEANARLQASGGYQTGIYRNHQAALSRAGAPASHEQDFFDGSIDPDDGIMLPMFDTDPVEPDPYAQYRRKGMWNYNEEDNDLL